MTPTMRWALRAYPPWFRERYGDELAALTEDVSGSWRTTAGLYVGAARAWLRPAYAGPEPVRRRLQASVSTVWVAWCAGFLLAPATTKALLDPPGPAVDATARRLVIVAGDLFLAGLVVALLGATFVVWRAVVPAVRAREWSALRPLLPALVLTVVDGAALGALALAARSGPPAATPAMIALGSVWLVGLLALLVAGGIGPAVSLRRLRPDAAVLKVPALLAPVLAACLAALTVCSTTAVLISGDATLVGGFAPVAAALVVGVVASSTALVSSTRGVLALRRG